LRSSGPTPTMPVTTLGHVTQCDICPSLEHLQGWWAPSPPWAACASALPLLLQRNVSYTQPDPPLVQLKAITSHPIAVTWSRGWAPPHHNLLSGSCREQWSLPWAPPLLQPEPSQLPLLLPIRFMLQTLHSSIAHFWTCKETEQAEITVTLFLSISIWGISEPETALDSKASSYKKTEA